MRPIGHFLKPRGRALKQYTCDAHFFDTIDTEEKAYFLGLLASDGWIGDGGQVALGLSGEEDAIVLERLCSALKTDARISRKQPNYPGAKPHFTLRLTSQRLATALSQHGVGPRKSLTLAFNHVIPANLMRHYVRGYFDGDGSVSIRRDGNALVGVTSSRLFVEGLAAYLQRTLGLNPHIERYMPPRNPESGSLKLGGNLVAFQFLDWIYRDAVIYLPRKEAKYRACRQLVVERLSQSERLYNLRGNETIMENARRCAALLGIELNVDGANGLSLPQSEQDEILRLYAQGYGIQHIRRMRACSNTLVRNVLTRNNVSIRNVRQQAQAQKHLLIAA